MDAWLGDVEVTDEQRAADETDTRERALIGAAKVILGDADLEGEEYLEVIV